MVFPCTVSESRKFKIKTASLSCFDSTIFHSVVHGPTPTQALLSLGSVCEYISFQYAVYISRHDIHIEYNMHSTYTISSQSTVCLLIIAKTASRTHPSELQPCLLSSSTFHIVHTPFVFLVLLKIESTNHFSKRNMSKGEQEQAEHSVMKVWRRRR